MKEGSVDFWKWLAKNVVLAALFVLVLVIVVSALLSAIIPRNSATSMALLSKSCR